MIAAGCLPGPRLTRPETPNQQLRSMLDSRASKLSKGDIDGYLAPLAPSAKEAERPLAVGITSVPTSSISLIPDRDIGPSPGSTVTGLEVDLVYRYEDLPEDNTFRVPMTYDLARKSANWQVTKSVLASTARLPIWASGPVSTSRSAHFLALFRPGLANPERSLETAERARAALENKITFPLEPSHLILLASDRSQYLQLSARTSPSAAIAHFESTYAITSTSIVSDGRQIIVNLSELTNDAESLETFQHELGHLALSPQTRPFTPPWITESAAMYLAGTRPILTWRQGVRTNRFNTISFSVLSRASSLGTVDPSGVSGSYEYAYAAAAGYYLIDSFGIEKYWDFYRSFAEVPNSRVYARISGADRDAAIATLADETTRESLTRLYGITLAQLDTAVRDWIRKQV